ncbi:hypothetical protein F4775DRAFT_591252 [Biscogniauxia sp. FL1348]|nr:hypothetical protein F4775DRAFT_591252 [Biscogniauxia sp. FL1348]
MCYINYYICSQCYHGYARFTNVCPKMHPPRIFCPIGTPFHIRIVDETACALYPYHAVPSHNHVTANINGGGVQAHDQSSQGTSSNEGQRAARTGKTGKGHRAKKGQRPNQREEPTKHHSYEVYTLGSQNQSFYPYHNTPMYPFYYGYSGDPAGQPPFQTPPPQPASWLASPGSHHTQESNQHTPLNPNAQVFHSRMSPDTSSDQRSGRAQENVEAGSSKRHFYNDRRGISRSVCNEDEYQPETNKGPQSTYADKDTQYESPTPRASEASSSGTLQTPSNATSQPHEPTPTSAVLPVAVPLVPQPKTHVLPDLPPTHGQAPSRGHKETKSEADAGVNEELPPPSHLPKDAGSESRDHPQTPGSAKQSPDLSTPEKHSEPGRLWSTKTAEAAATSEHKPSSDASLFSPAAKPEEPESARPRPESTEDPAQRDVPYTGGHPTTTAAPNAHGSRSPQTQARPRDEQQQQPRKIFAEADFPALGLSSSSRPGRPTAAAVGVSWSSVVAGKASASTPTPTPTPVAEKTASGPASVGSAPSAQNNNPTPAPKPKPKLTLKPQPQPLLWSQLVGGGGARGVLSAKPASRSGTVVSSSSYPALVSFTLSGGGDKDGRGDEEGDGDEKKKSGTDGEKKEKKVVDVGVDGQGEGKEQEEAWPAL